MFVTTITHLQFDQSAVLNEIPLLLAVLGPAGEAEAGGVADALAQLPRKVVSEAVEETGQVAVHHLVHERSVSDEVIL